MRLQRRKSLLIAGCVFALLAIAAISALLLLDVNKFKPNIESAVFDATGLNVRINGKMEFSFFPFGLSAKDIHVANKEDEIISLENLKLGVELMPLLKKQLKITSCSLFKPAATIVKDADGKYNFESTEKKFTNGVPGAIFGLNNFKLTQGELFYLDKRTGEKTELKEFNLAVKDLSTGESAVDIIKNLSFTGSFDCKEVLQKDCRIGNLKASIKAVSGIYHFEPLVIGTLVYLDKSTGEETALKEIDLTINDLSVGDTSEAIIKNISFTGNMACREMRKKDLKIDNIKSPMKVEKGVLYLTPLTMDIFGSEGVGDITANRSEADATYKINLKISKLDFAKLEESFGAKKVIGGKGDFYASLTMKEKGKRNLMSSMDGTFSLRGDNLVIYTMDLDSVLSSYETSQEFNLVDLGAFFIAGPLGTAALKGYHYGDLYSQTQGGQGAITQFISHWKIKDGVADATDCALATHHNRVALKGKINLVSERYENVTVALLDEKGCVKFKQSISGPFSSPQVGSVQSLANPIFNLYKKAKRFVQGGKCEVFYKGAVQQP